MAQTVTRTLREAVTITQKDDQAVVLTNTELFDPQRLEQQQQAVFTLAIARLLEESQKDADLPVTRSTRDEHSSMIVEVTCLLDADANVLTLTRFGGAVRPDLTTRDAFEYAAKVVKECSNSLRTS